MEANTSFNGKLEKQKKHIFDVYLGDGVVINIQECDIDYLLELRESILVQISDIESQIEKAKSLAASEGIFSDRIWFLSVQKSLRVKKTQINIIERRLKELRRRQQEDHVKALESFYENYYKSSKKFLAKPIIKLIEDEVKSKENSI